MTPERVAFYVDQALADSGCDGPPVSDVERAITQAVNEALEEAAKSVGECRVLVTETDPLAVAQETAESLAMQIAALNLPEEP